MPKMHSISEHSVEKTKATEKHDISTGVLCQAKHFVFKGTQNTWFLLSIHGTL
jgi:hypothetical protein